MRVLTTNLVGVTFDHGEVHDLSVEFLKVAEGEGASAGVSALAAGLTLGRLLSPSPLGVEDEADWLEAVMTFTGAYFADGES
jgi:hypothetical protein